jgi:hypothetical protein
MKIIVLFSAHVDVTLFCSPDKNISIATLQHGTVVSDNLSAREPQRPGLQMQVVLLQHRSKPWCPQPRLLLLPGSSLRLLELASLSLGRGA